MNERDPQIRPMPTEAGFKKAVDLVLGDDPNDAAIKSLVDMLLMTANPEDAHAWEMAQATARHAYAKSADCEQAFRKFADAPGGFVAMANQFTVTRSDDGFEVVNEIG